MKLIELLICLLLILCGTTQEVIAQEWLYDYKEINIGAGYETPLNQSLGDYSLLYDYYKPSLSYSAGYSSFKGNNAIEYGAGFIKFSPQQEIFTFEEGGTVIGTAEFSDYIIGYIYVGFKRAFPMNFEIIVPYVGVDVGYHYTYYESDISMPGSNTGSTSLEGKGNIAPKAGVDYYFSQAVGVFAEAKYNAMLSVGSNDVNSSDYNSNLGQVDFFLTSKLGLKFRF